jgi:hypothetical protein
MANYYAAARSNSFRVKDIEDLRDYMHPEVEIRVDSEEENRVTLLVEAEAGWPGCVFDEETGDDIDWDVESAVAPHLVDGEWCVIREVGNEKLRYLIGYTLAFNNKGDSFTVNLDDIYKQLPEGVTSCEY